MTGNVLSDDEVDRFVEEGFVHLEHVVPTEVVTVGGKVLWADMGLSPDDPTTWTQPVVRLLPSETAIRLAL
jgi:hypothetical protein